MRDKAKTLKLGIVLAIILAIVGIFVLVNADNSKLYVVDVLNAKDTEDDAMSREEVKIHKKIEKDNSEQPYYDAKNLTYSVSVSNINEVKTPEIALVLDTSYSMKDNDQESQLKTNAINLVSEIYKECSNAKIQLFNAAGSKTNKLAYTSNNQKTITDTINALQIGDGNDISNGLNAAKTSFTAGDNIDSYIIVFTDATDNTKELLEEIDSNNIKIIAVSLDNIISNSYTDTNIMTKMVYSTNYTDDDKLYEEFKVEEIAKLINYSLNIKVTDIFSEALKQYFEFELISTDEEENLEKTEDGYIWSIENLKYGLTKKLVYKLNLKEGISIEDTQYKYHPLTVSDKISVDYSRYDYSTNGNVTNSFEVEKENIPVIQICEKYSVTLKAVSEESSSLSIEGIEFKVIAKDKDENVIFNDTLTTDSKGEVVIDNLKTSGTVHFEVTPSVSISGYDTTDTVELEISNQNGVGFVMETVEFKDKFLSEEDKRNCTVTIPINTKKFNLEINLTELNNATAAIGNTEFRLIQPKLNDKFEMSAKFAETDSTGKAVFTPTVMTKAGTYEYILSQMTVQDGYISMGNVTIRIKFDKDGNIVEDGVVTAYNDYVTGERKGPKDALIKVQNATQKEDMFNLELNLTDEEDNKIKLSGAEYDIEIKRISGGKEVTNTYHNCQTNEKGKLLIDLPGSGNIQLRIKQVKATTGYYINEEAKIITIRRQDGTVQEVLQAYNEDTHTTVDASAYSSENKLIVNLTNKIRYERNILNIKLSDYEENDVILSNIEVQIANLSTGATYTAITGIDGVARFQIDDQEQGEYQYQVKILSELPNYYNNIPNSSYNIRFDDKQHMEMISDLWDDDSKEESPIISIEPVQAIENEEFLDYSATINLGAIVSDESTYWFELNLTDRDTGVALEGASYNIKMTAGDVVREIKGRKTDAQGKIKTRIILNEELMSIEVTQQESITKYKMDNSTKEIDLKYSNGRLSFLDPSISDTTINGNIVSYKHKNIKKTGDDVLLDLTIIKEDKDGFLAGNLPVRIYQEAQGENSISTTDGYVHDGVEYGSWLETSGESQTPIPMRASDGLDITTKTNNQGTIVLKGLKVNNIPIPGDAEFILYVTELDAVTGEDKPGTTIKYKITYRYNTNKEIVEITNVESTLGNRLVKEKTFNGYEASLGYQSNIFTTTYTNYEDVGNLEIDLKKLDKNSNELTGAEYTVKVLRPDSSTVSRNIVVENGSIEIPGLMVTEGSQIELTETKAPIGYQINEATEVFDVTKIDETGEIYLELQTNNYKEPRVKLEKKGTYMTTSASLKTQYDITLIDYELDIFEIKITARDSKQNKPIEGYSFNINSSKGSQKVTGSTDGSGTVETLIGGKYEEETVTYDITKSKNAEYYKDFTPFTLQVQFDEDKKVDLSTLDIQTDSNYGELDNGKTWKIKAVNVADGSDIEIEVYIEPEDPLEVEIETIDAISGNKLTNTTYSIQPSVGYYSGKGSLDETTNNTIVKVGYVEKGKSREYTLKTEVPNNYENLADQLFTVYYDENGDIDTTQPPTTTSRTMTITSYSGKKITLRNVIEPKQGIQIVNKDYFTGQNITGAQFDVTTESGETKTVPMGLLGIGSTLGDKNGEANTSVKYKIHQRAVASGYATIPDFEIEVAYGQNREITNVTLTNTDCQIWVNPTFIKPSTETDAGYNGNDKGIVKIEINSYYDFRINIENVDRLDKTIKIVGTQYEVTSTEKETGNPISNTETNASGLGMAHLDDLKLNKKVVYTIKELAPSTDYQPLEVSEINVEVEFDSQGFIIPSSVKVVTGYGENYAVATGISPVVNDTDKFTINLQITSLPKFRMNINNIDYFNNAIKLSGTKYKVTSEVGDSIDNNVTDSDGNVTLRVNGNPKNKVTYTIHEENPSVGYQSIEEDIKIEVIFDETNGTVQSCNVIQGNRFSTATTLTNIVTTYDKLSINVEIKSIELLRFELNNIYEERDTSGNINNIPLTGSKYKISAIEISENQNLNVDASGVTDPNGMATIGINKALSNKTIKYVITQEKSAVGYKRLDYEILIQVSFDNDGKIKDGTWSIIQNESGESSSNFAQITNVDIDNFTISVQIKSNKLVDFVIKNVSTTVDDSGAVTSIDPVVNSTYEISAKEASTNTNLEVNNEGTTDTNGNTRISMDRALANKTIHYTITEKAKSVGYNWIDCEIVLEASFDAQGRIIENSTKIISNSDGVSANSFTTITNVDINNYEISLKIENTPIKEFGIHLVARDMYSDAPIDGVKANVYLADNTIENPTLISDNKYDFSVINKDLEVSNEDYKYLCTGADRDGDGSKDVADGEDYLSMGEYMEGTNTNRKLRVILRDVPEPYQWYANNSGTKQEFHIVISVEFDDEGKIIGTRLNTGLDSSIGWLADERYVSVSSTGYGLTIKLKFYPMLYVKMESEDMYTGETIESRLNFSTSSYPVMISSNSDRIQEGYIGYTYDCYGSVYQVKSNHNFIRTATAENNRERTFYIYEETIPRESESYYQKYRPYSYPSYSYYQNSLIATVKVFYDENGKIKDAQPTSYISSNNITEDYIELSWEDYYLHVKVKYAPTTKVVAKLVDRVTGEELNNIKIYPFNEGKKRYEYYSSDSGYETTSATGKASWTYWGANQAGSTSTYVMKTAFSGNEYNGYFLPGDVKIDVGYGDKGRISAVQVLSQNTFGDALNAEADWEDTTVYLTIKLDRKFNLKIDKKDIYDSTKNLNVKFDIESNKHEKTTINAWNTVAVGRIHPGETVEYTLSETSTIDGYVQLSNIKLYVQFNTDGTVERAYVDKSKTKYFEVHSKADVEAGKKGVNTTDLEVIIKNTPTLSVTGTLTDSFYNNCKLQGAIFTIENNKGESASGGLITNSNGTFTTSVGEVYLDEEITYTMKQASIVNGYRENTEIMEFKVKYNENGYIENYTVTKGNDVFTIQPEIYKGSRELKLEVKNEPKNVNIGIINLDATTGEGINNVEFKVDITDVLTNNTTSETYITQTHDGKDGIVSGKVDDVEKSNVPRAVKYKISEITIPDTYRKIQDIEIEVIYNEDGSISTYNVLQNDSDVDIKVYRKGSNITTINGLPAHIQLKIKNDNRYDLIVKNEDINYTGLGIQGTKYDVSIDGVSKSMPTTDENGKTGLYKLEGSGEITIRIAENGVGNGYRDNNQNDTIIVLEKGESVYSLNSISNSNPTNATVDVDEGRGTVTVTFKNETKLELEVKKYGQQEEGGSKPLENIVFEITSQEVDNYGNSVGDPTEITTKDENDTTDSNGKLYFDLGVTPQNKIIEYTIKEVTELEGYLPLDDVKITATFNMYGQLESISDNSAETNTIHKQDNNNGITALITNYLIPEDSEIIYPEYTIKVATEDIVTNKRINGSKFDIEVTKDDNTSISSASGVSTENRTTEDGYLLEKGVIVFEKLKEDGNINIDVDQIEAATGYEFSDKTSGTIKINVQYTEVPDRILADINISLIEDDGFTVKIDNKNREVIITLKNKPGVTLHIDKYYETYEKDEEAKTTKVEKPVEGTKFTITSEIQTSSEIITTDLNKETKSTDENGKTSTSVGIPYAGKTILYTLKETPPDGFEEVEDIVVLVKYDSSGNIKYTEVLSNEDVTEIKEPEGEESFGVGTKEFAIRVKNTQKANETNYKIILEKHSINDGEYDYLIPNTEYEITVQEEYGTQRTWTAFTNEEGKIESPTFSGYGRIKVIYTELTAAEGYQKDDKTYEIEFSRDRITGKLTPISSDENYQLDDENNDKVYLKPQDDLQIERYDIIINKIDSSDNSRIINNQAAFNVSMFETQQIIKEATDEDGNIIFVPEENIVETQLGSIATDTEGKAKLTTIKMPEEEGTYKIKISEIKAPEGYQTIEDGVYLNVTFTKNDSDTMEITKVENLSESQMDLLKIDKQIISMNLKNERKEYDLKEDEFAFDITKIDSKTKEAITVSEAIFRLTDEKDNKQYIETNIENGKLIIPYIKMPTDDEFISRDTEDTTSVTVERIYQLQEIMAPEGYIVNTDPIDIKITFAKDSENKTIIQDVEVMSGENTIDVTEENRIISFNVENTEGELVNNTDRGRYTINITKIDKTTENPVTGHATFVVTLENGEKVTASTDENGNLQIKDIKVPATVTSNLGPYSYVIEETRPADGYQPISGYSIMELTFKELTDPTTGELTGLYGIDDITNVPVLTLSESATITSYTESEVNITITNNKESYTVKYDANCDDATVTVPADQTKYNGIDITLDETTPTREGYIFKGWATTPETEEGEYLPGDTYSENSDITLYAIWEKYKVYTIEYDVNCDDASIAIPENQTKEDGVDIELDTMEPTREGYIFDGWSTTPEATEGEYLPGDTYSENSDVTLYAVWTEKIFLKSKNYIIANTEMGTKKVGRNEVNVYLYNEKVKEEESIYEVGDKYILGILPQPGNRANAEYPGTTFEMFKEKIDTNADEIKLYRTVMNSEKTEIIQEEVKDEELVGTAMTLKLQKGKRQTIEIQLVVRGDTVGSGTNMNLCGDGKILGNDKTQAIDFIARHKQEDVLARGEAFMLALDINLDGIMNGQDQTRITATVDQRTHKELLRGLLK